MKRKEAKEHHKLLNQLIENAWIVDDAEDKEEKGSDDDNESDEEGCFNIVEVMIRLETVSSEMLLPLSLHNGALQVWVTVVMRKTTMMREEDEDDDNDDDEEQERQEDDDDRSWRLDAPAHTVIDLSDLIAASQHFLW